MYSETADSRKHLTVQGRNTRIIYEICSKLSIKTTDIIDIILLSVLLTLNIIHTIFLVLLLLTLSMYLLDEITVYSSISDYRKSIQDRFCFTHSTPGFLKYWDYKKAGFKFLHHFVMSQRCCQGHLWVFLSKIEHTRSP